MLFTTSLRAALRRWKPPRRSRSCGEGGVQALESRVLLSASGGIDELPGTDGIPIETPSPVHAVFAPGTSPDYIAAVEEIGESGIAQAQLTSRWSSTATNGSGLAQGDVTTLTWSIAPDGTAIGSFIGEGAGASDLVSFLSGIYGITTNDTNYQDEAWFSLFEDVFDRWSELTGITYVYESHDDGAAFSSFSTAAPGVLGVRGDVRIGGHLIDGTSGTLAYNFYPNNGEMVLDTGDGFFSFTNNDSRRLRNVVAHEAGHGIGLQHVESSDSYFLMEPYIITTFDGPQFDDILGAQRLYGDALEDTGNGNNSTANPTSLGLLEFESTLTIGADANDQRVESFETDLISIDDESDIDVFSFSVTDSTTLSIALTPVGPTYMQGAQGGSQTTFNAQSQSDLTLALLDTNGTTLLSLANAGGLGQSEFITDLTLATGGTYFVRVTGATVNVVQTYQLQLNLGSNLAANRPPVVEAQAFDVLKATVNGTEVGAVIASDPDSGQSLTYQFGGGNGLGVFAIDSTTGMITVVDAALLATVTRPKFELTVLVADDGSPAAQALATVTITVINQPPVIADQSLSVLKSATSGTEVGTVVASDPDVAQTLTYQFIGGNRLGIFAIDSTTGTITIADDAQLASVTRRQYALTVLVKDNGAPIARSQATVTITVLNEPPVVADQSFTVSAADSAGTHVGFIQASDPNTAQKLSFAFSSGNGSGAFALDAATGELTLLDPNALNPLKRPEMVLVIRVRDDGSPNMWTLATITITVTP